MTGFGVTTIPLPVFWSTSQKDREQLRRRHQQPHFCQNSRCAANSAASSPPCKVDTPKRPKRSSTDFGGQRTQSSTVVSDGTPTQTKVSGGGVMAGYYTDTERCADCNLSLGPRRSVLRSLRDMYIPNAPRKRVSESNSNGSISHLSSRNYACSVSTPARIPKKPSADTRALLSPRSRSSSILSSSPRRALTQADTAGNCREHSGIHGPNCRGPFHDFSESPHDPGVSSCPSGGTCASVPTCPSPSCPSAPHCSPVPDFTNEPSSPRFSNVPHAAEHPSGRESQDPCSTENVPQRDRTVTSSPVYLPFEESRDSHSAEDRCTVRSPKIDTVAGPTAELARECRANEDHHSAWCNASTERSYCGSFSPSCPISPRRLDNRPSGVVGPSQTFASRRSPSFSAPRVTSRTLPPLECARGSRRTVTPGAVQSLSKESTAFDTNDFSSLPQRSPRSQCVQNRCATLLQKRVCCRAPSKRPTGSNSTQMCLLEQRIEDEELGSESSDQMIVFDDSPKELCEVQLCSAFERVSNPALANVRQAPVMYNAKEELAINAGRRNGNKDRKLRVALEIAVLTVMVTLLVIVFYPIFISGFTTYFYGCCSCPTDSASSTGVEGDTVFSQMRSNNFWVYSGVRNLLKCPLAQQAMGSTVLK